MIELDQVRLELASLAGPVNILRGLDLRIEAGEHVSVVGPSGSGKSSMLMVIGGLERPTGGTVRIAGRDIGRMSEDALALFRRSHVGIVFQNFHLIPTMTAQENVALPRELAGQRGAHAAARAALEAVGLGHRLTHYPGQLSGGEQQRVALARAFVGEPSLILADEPTGNLDGATGRQIIDLLFDLAARHGTTLLLITHDPAVAQRCDRQVRIANGLIESDTGAVRQPAAATA